MLRDLLIPSGYYKDLAVTGLVTTHPVDGVENLAQRAGYDHANILKSWRTLSSSTPQKGRRYHTALTQHPTHSRHILFMTGDARTILHHSSKTINKRGEIVDLSSSVRHQLQQDIETQESTGSIVISVASKHMHQSSLNKEDMHGMVFLGMATATFDILQDHKEQIRRMKDNERQITITSSESLPLTKAFAKRLGVVSLDDSAVTGHDIMNMQDSELKKHLPHIKLFAELIPSDTVRITRLLEELGHHVLRK